MRTGMGVNGVEEGRSQFGTEMTADSSREENSFKI